MPNPLGMSLTVMIGLGAYQLAVPASIRTNLPYTDAIPIIEALRGALPPELKTKTPPELEAAWPEWISEHDAQIRSRVERGDEDSIVNLLLFGTTFTTRARAPKPEELAKPGGQARAGELIQGRIEDLIAALAAPGTNERLRFARQVMKRIGIDPTTPAGKAQARRYLKESGSRLVGELAAYKRTVEATTRVNASAKELAELSTLYRNRGLSSDTTLLPDFAIQQALEVMRSQHVLSGPVRRVAVVGPGLDFTDKAYGYDFYPVQTIQPFAIIDSLIRLGLARLDDLRVRTLDLSPRINRHIEETRARAMRGAGYVVALPLSRDENWNPSLLSYWKQFGNDIGARPTALFAPERAGMVTVRAVEIPPKVVESIFPDDVNIIVQRLVPASPDERFDLVIATNILTYYDVFDQSLALANIESMLRPGGFLLSNNVMLPETAFTRSGRAVIVNYNVRQFDQVFWYQRH